MCVLLSGGGHHDVMENAGMESLQYIGSSLLLYEVATGSKWVFEGRVLEHDNEPRTMAATRDLSQSPPTRPRSGGAAEKTALDVLAADSTGPVLLTLWDDIAAAFMAARSRNSWQEGVCTLIRLEGVRVKELPRSNWNGDCLTPMKILHSITPMEGRAGTVLSMPLEPSSPFLVTAQYTPPTSVQCVSHYAPVRAKLVPPFRCTVKGTIVDVQDPDMAQSGNPKRLFDIVDEVGFWMRCCAVGRNAGASAIVAGNVVVMYFCTGRGSIGSSGGMLYLMKDALVVKIGQEMTPIAKRQEIQLG